MTVAGGFGIWPLVLKLSYNHNQHQQNKDLLSYKLHKQVETN